MRHAVHQDFVARGELQVGVEDLEVRLAAGVGEHGYGDRGIAVPLHGRLERGGVVERVVLHGGIQKDYGIHGGIGPGAPREHRLRAIAVPHRSHLGDIGKGQRGGIAQKELQIVQGCRQISVDVQAAGIRRLVCAAQDDVAVTGEVFVGHGIVIEGAAQAGMVNDYRKLAGRRSYILRGEDRRGQRAVPGGALFVVELIVLFAHHVQARHVAGELAQALGEFGDGRIDRDGAEIIAVDHGHVVLGRRGVPDTDEDWPRPFEGRAAGGRVVGIIGSRHI